MAFSIAPMLKKAAVECEELREIYDRKHEADYQFLEDFLRQAKEKLDNLDVIETSALSKTNGISLPSRKSKVRKETRVSVSTHRAEMVRKSNRLSAVSLKHKKRSTLQQKSFRSPVATNSSIDTDKFLTPEQELKPIVKTPQTVTKASPPEKAAPVASDVLNTSKRLSLRSAVLTASSKKSVGNASVKNTPSIAETSYTSYEISHLRASDDSEEDDAVHKPIPKWATGICLKEALLKQHYNCPKTKLLENEDDNAIEPYEMFGIKKKRDVLRSSSAIWDTPDRNML